jgi:hypothetical protein
VEQPDERVLAEVQADPSVQRKLEQVGLHERMALKGLQEFEGWRLQRERFARFKVLATEKLAKRLLSGEDVPREEIAFQRGYAACVADIFDWPERVEQDLGNAALRAWERALAGTTDDPAWQPYE